MSLRVCIDARLASGEVGGVEQVVLGTASGLSALTDGDEEYVFLTYADYDWLKPYIRGNCRVEALDVPAPTTLLKASIGNKYPVLKKIWHTFSPLLGRRTVSMVDGSAYVARIQPDIVHFVIQQAFLTTVPSIYSPFDLQHLHLPQNFTPRERYARELLYRTFCAQAATVVAASHWGKHDLIENYGLEENKVQVIPVGNILSHYPQPNEQDLQAARRKFDLPERYLYFPAATFPSKNHIGLLRALAQTRDQGVEIPLICSGRLSQFFPKIEQAAATLGLTQQVKFLDFVSPLEVQCLYRLSAGLIFPTLFEGWGQPVVEAFDAGVPVACSNVTSLPEVAGDSALLFDPHSTDAISMALIRLWQDDALRRRLIASGRERAKLFTWERTARIFRAHYRRIAGRTLAVDDQALIDAPLIAESS